MYDLGQVPVKTRAEFEALSKQIADAERQQVHDTLDVLEGKTTAAQQKLAAGKLVDTGKVKPTAYAMPDITVDTTPTLLIVGLVGIGAWLILSEGGKRGSRKVW